MRRWFRYEFVATFLLVISVIMNVYLAGRAYWLVAAMKRLRAERTLTVGATVPPLVGKSPDGTPQEVAYNTANIRTILYVFSPGCKYCEANEANVARLFDRRTLHFRYVAVALGDEHLREYLPTHNVIPTVIRPSPQSMLAYRFSGTPQTIVVGPSGEVEHVWGGAYAGSLRNEIERYFGVQLEDAPLKQGP